MTHAEWRHAELLEDAVRAIDRVYEDESVSLTTVRVSLGRLADVVAMSLGGLREISVEAKPNEAAETAFAL